MLSSSPATSSQRLRAFRRSTAGIAGMCLALMVVVAATRVAAGSPQALEGLTLQLVAETSAIKPGVPFAVGLHIRHAAGFHTYWKNPGIVGVPTKIDWQLPAGFTAGEIEWPQPQLTKMAIYPVYGYEGEVLLPVTITPPKQLDHTTAEVTLTAKASWMCCSNTCHPGFAELAVRLPVCSPTTTVSKTAHHAEFEKARARRPIRTSAWHVQAERNDDGIVLEMRPTTDKATIALASMNVASIYFFSGDGHIDSRAAQAFRRVAGDEPLLRVTLTLGEHLPVPQNGNARLVGVVTADSPWLPETTAKAIAVDVPITPGNGETGDR